MFYALTNHIKPSQFERVVQALVFTAIIKVVVILEYSLLVVLGDMWRPFGNWTADADLVAALFTAPVLGLFASAAINRDWLHKWLRKLGISRRSGDASEWGYVFSTRQRHVVLCLNDDRRLYGWPEVWPSNSENGHFFITEASWHSEAGDIDLPGSEGVVVSVKDVKFVEFLKQGNLRNDQGKIAQQSSLPDTCGHSTRTGERESAVPVHEAASTSSTANGNQEGTKVGL